MELTNDEQLALLVAMDKRLKPALDDAKSEARARLMDGFGKTGDDRHAIRVGTEKVGEVGISYSKAEPVIMADKQEEALDYLRSIGLTTESPSTGWQRHFALVGDKVVCTDTGEAVDFLLWQPSAAKNAVVRGCKPEDVLGAFQGRLPSEQIMALIEGAN